MNRPVKGRSVTIDDFEDALTTLWVLSGCTTEAVLAINDIRLYCSGDKTSIPDALLQTENERLKRALELQENETRLAREQAAELQARIDGVIAWVDAQR